ncbi:MAG TPA: endonuclease/exonuclease/phosphatase family protein [Candidatus Kryptonia bacterium]|nr:endonuclease/exonuclease/phosphatase family protein [Candidatus Kryptonia bacterium]
MTANIPQLSAAEIAALRSQVATRSAELRRELVWLDTIDARHADATKAPASLRVVAFNAERGSRFEGIRELLAHHPELRRADVVLLSEVDWGMARSGNRHVARDLANALGLGYAFGIEFLELTKGEAAELDAPGDNTLSLHGNAILSRWPLDNVQVLRLPVRCSWAEGSQARIGSRMAVLGEVRTAGGWLTLASTHLENRTSPQGRAEQMRALLSTVVGDHPAVIGGDLNTSTIDSGDNDQILSVPQLLQANPHRLRQPEGYEPLFADVRDAGFLVDEVNAAGVPTNVPLGILDPTYWLKVDWIFARGVRPVRSGPPKVVAAELDGARVSDHDFVVADVEVE